MKIYQALGFLWGALFCSQVNGFCGDRRQVGDLTRSAVRAAEWMRSFVVSGATLGHVRAAAYHSLRLVGYQVTSDDVNKLKSELDKAGVNNITIGRLAYYTNGIISACQNPADFYGHNLINPLIFGVKNYPIAGSLDHPFAYSLVLLALCMSRSIDGLPVDYSLLTGVSLTHGTDTLAMATIALSCIYKTLPDDKPNKARRAQVARILLTATTRLRALQKPDGSYGNSISTAKVVQALLSAGVEPEKWKCPKTMDFLLRSQQAPGSFQNYVMATAQVMPALIGAIPHDVMDLACPHKPAVYPRHPITVCVRLEFLTSTPSNTTRTPPPPVSLTVLNGTAAYEILQLAGLQHACYHFTTTNSAYGRSVQSICGVAKDSVNKKYWIIFQDPAKWAPAGIDSFRPADGSCLIFKYMKLNF